MLDWGQSKILRIPSKTVEEINFIVIAPKSNPMEFYFDNGASVFDVIFCAAHLKSNFFVFKNSSISP